MRKSQNLRLDDAGRIFIKTGRTWHSCGAIVQLNNPVPPYHKRNPWRVCMWHPTPGQPPQKHTEHFFYFPTEQAAREAVAHA